MSLASAVVLLQTALSLLTLVNANPSLPQSMRDNAQQVAQQAIAQANAAIAGNNAPQTNQTSNVTSAVTNQAALQSAPTLKASLSPDTIEADLAPSLAYITCNFYNKYGNVRRPQMVFWENIPRAIIIL